MKRSTPAHDGRAQWHRGVVAQGAAALRNKESRGVDRGVSLITGRRVREFRHGDILEFETDYYQIGGCARLRGNCANSDANTRSGAVAGWRLFELSGLGRVAGRRDSRFLCFSAVPARRG